MATLAGLVLKAYSPSRKTGYSKFFVLIRDKDGEEHKGMALAQQELLEGIAEGNTVEVTGTKRGEWMNLREIASARRFPGDMIVNWGADAEEEARLREKMQRYFDATTHILEGHLHHIVRDARAELREYEAALAINPDDVDAPYLAERVIRLSRRLPVD